MWLFSRDKLQMPDPTDALPGRATPIVEPGRHLVLGTPLAPPYPEGSEIADFALGCLWGEEREFWQTHDVFEVLGNDGWQVVDEAQVGSVYVTRVDRHGATLRVPKKLLARVGAKPGTRLQARIQGRKLVIESR